MNEMLEFIGQHPWISFFIAVALAGAIGDILAFLIVAGILALIFGPLAIVLLAAIPVITIYVVVKGIKNWMRGDKFTHGIGDVNLKKNIRIDRSGIQVNGNNKRVDITNNKIIVNGYDISDGLCPNCGNKLPNINLRGGYISVNGDIECYNCDWEA